MPYGLDSLWDKNNVITYVTGRAFRISESYEEIAFLLVKWANELYPEWGSWIR